MHLDIVFAADPRFPGGTSTSTATEILAAARAGLAVGLLPFRGPTLKTPRFHHPDLQARLDAGDAVLLAPETAVTADLVLVEHSSLFTHMPARPVALRARAAGLVANHPPRFPGLDGGYDPAAVVEAIDRYFGAPAFAIPISPITRALLAESRLDPARVLDVDWPRVIDPAAWDLPIRRPVAGLPLVVGRHARPSAAKWPDEAAEILAVYPADGRPVVLLGGGPPPERLAVLPPTWTVLPFDPARPLAFLAAIDVYVHFHSRRYVESFGMGPLEAMAAGKVVILPPLYRPLFGEAALYARPEEVADLLRALDDDPARYVAQAARARAIAGERFGLDAWRAGHDAARRFAGLPALPDRPARPAPRPPAPQPRRRVLFMSSNGTGLGHITRLMAIAERLPAGIEPMFLTLSQGAALVRARGFAVDFLPSHQGRGFADGVWNRALAHELALALHHFRPDALVFDGSAPYQGLLEVLGERPDLAAIWVRRGLWRPGQNEAMPARAAHFDAVIEPGELAGAEDVGATAALRPGVISVPPIVLVDPADRLDRAAARAALDLPPAGPLVLLQLGSGVDYDLTDLRARMVELLLARGVGVVEVVSPIAAVVAAAEDGVVRRKVYPLARVAAAFDLVVTEAGYNSFHEIVLGGLPAVLVPRDGGGMDDQMLRARYAESIGLAVTLRARDVALVETVLDRVLAPGFAAAVAARAARLGLRNGAGDAARFIAESALAIRADRPLAYAVAR